MHIKKKRNNHLLYIYICTLLPFIYAYTNVNKYILQANKKKKSESLRKIRKAIRN